MYDKIHYKLKKKNYFNEKKKKKNTGVGCHALLQGIVQGENTGVLNCRQILYHMRHQASLRILEWVAYPFSKGLSQPGN